MECNPVSSEKDRLLPWTTDLKNDLTPVPLWAGVFHVLPYLNLVEGRSCNADVAGSIPVGSSDAVIAQ